MRHTRASKCILLLVVLCAVTWAGAAQGAQATPDSLSAAEVTLHAIADATINSASPTTNYGRATSLETQVGGRTVQGALLRFDLRNELPDNAVIESARLELYLLASSGALRVEFMASNLDGGWDESRVTWNNKPAVGRPTTSPFWVSATVNQWQSWDVTAIAQAWQEGREYGLLLGGVDGAPDFRRSFASRDYSRGAYIPRLVVTYHLTRPTPTYTPTRILRPTPTHTPTQTPIALDLSILHLEVTQGIQSVGNLVPLVARKRTYVRAHVKSNGGSWPGVKGEFAFGHSLAPSTGWLPADNPQGTITVKPNPDRGEVQDSFFIEIPPSVLVPGTLWVNFRLNANHQPPEGNYDNNTKNIDLPLSEVPKVKVKIFNVQYEVSGQEYQTPFQHMAMMASWLRRAYPVPGVLWQYRTLNWWSSKTPGEAGCGAMNGVLTFIRWIEGNPAEWRYYAMVEDTGSWMRGCSKSIPSYVASGPTGDPQHLSWAAWDDDIAYGDWYGAHELGHSYGRHHTLCKGTEAGPDLNYPYPNGRIGGGGYLPSLFYGWDIEQRVVYGPDWTDIMTYCDYEWMSDYTYAGLRQRLIDEAAAASQVEPQAAEAADYLAVLGMANLTRGTAELSTLYRLSHTTEPPPPIPSAEWTLALLDGGGGTLASHAFTPNADTEAVEGEEVMASISEMVPWVPGTARIVILYRGSEVAGREVSANAPTVQVLYPNGGEVLTGAEVRVRWSSADADRDALTHLVQYSPDAGRTWQTVAVDVLDSQVTLRLGELAGSSAALFRIIASDGVNTGQDQSDGTFTVWDKPPQAFIISPAAGSRYELGQQVMLVGEGFDIEDGVLPEDSLSWSSDRQGDLGSGAQLAVTNLQQGAHVITLRATDHDEQSGTASVSVFVGVEPHKAYLPIVLKLSRP
jgi:hypothetical protein